VEKAREKIMGFQEVKQSFYTYTTKWPNIKMEMENWVTDQRHKEYCVSKNHL
jgi:uncharacterized protein (UPF0333 family)